MPQQRDPRRDEAFEIWKQQKGDITNRELANQLDVPEKTISSWKSRDKWNAVLQKNERSTAKRIKKKKHTPKPIKSEQEEPLLSDDLTDKQRIFCMYYLKYFNATKAYQKAYGCSYEVANKNAYLLMVNHGIKAEIERMKQEQANGLMIDAQFVLQKYIDIAFSDITDFTSFGKREIEVTDDLGNVEVREVNFVDFKSSDEVDGTIITEVKLGRDGVSIKLADKMKALDKLSLYFDLFPDQFKRRIEEEKLKLAQQKASGEGNDDDEIIDDWVDSVMDSEEDE